MRLVNWIVFVLILIPALESIAQEPSVSEINADEIKALIERVEELEQRERERPTPDHPVAEFDDENENLAESLSKGASSMLGGRLDLGGFLTQNLTFAHGNEDNELSPNQTQFEILVRADISERVHLFAATGFLREADLDLSSSEKPQFRNFQNRVPLILGWANYEHREALQLRVGRFITPHGIINREHFAPLLLDPKQPQFLRPFSGSTVFPNFMNGLELHGNRAVGELDSLWLEYSAYFGVFNQSADRYVSGGRLAFEYGDWATFGLNYSHGSRDAGSGPLGHASLVPASSTVENNYDLIGAELLVDHGKLLWKSEFYYTIENGEEDRLAYYTQPAWRFSDRWVAFYRYDFLEPGQNALSSQEHVIGLNFLPVPEVRIRGIVTYKDILKTSRDVLLSELNVTFSF